MRTLHSFLRSERDALPSALSFTLALSCCFPAWSNLNVILAPRDLGSLVLSAVEVLLSEILRLPEQVFPLTLSRITKEDPLGPAMFTLMGLPGLRPLTEIEGST